MVMVALLATQCKKSVEPLANEPAGETMEVTVRVQNNTAKTDITAAGAVSWKKGDKLYVVGATQGLLGYVSAVADGDPAQFEGKITALTSAQVLRFYYVGDKEFTLDGSGNYIFDLSSQDGTLAGIAAHSQLMFGKSEEIAAGTTDFGTIAMTSLMAIAHLNITGNTSNTVTVTGGFATSTFNAKTYDGAALTGAARNITMTSASAIGDCHLALLPGTQTLTFRAGAKEAKLSQKDVAANTFYNSESAIEVTMTLPEGALPGLFTVSDNGTPGDTSDDIKVCFSKGNLQFHTTNKTWQFAANQYDLLDISPVTPHQTTDYAENTNKWIDLFGWGTSGVEYEGHGTSFQPWSTEETATTYGPSTGDLSTSAGSDWGCNINGGQIWRTLSITEWTYLLGTSSERNGKYSNWVTVNGVQGFIIAPDVCLNEYNFDNTKTTYNLSDWNSAEVAGCVFLPAAGHRIGANVKYVQAGGYYWSSSVNGSQSARRFGFNSSNIFLEGSLDRYLGLSVRLVTNAN